MMDKQYIFSGHNSIAEQKKKMVHLFFDGLILLAALTIFVIILASQSTGILRAESAKSEDTQAEALDASSMALNQLLIGVHPDTTDSELRTLLAARGMKLIKRWEIANGALVELAEPAVRKRVQVGNATQEQQLTALGEARRSLESLPQVRHVTCNTRISAAGAQNANRSAIPYTEQLISFTELVPNDPEFPNQWALEKVRAVDGWTITQGDPDVVVAVIDSGYTPSHPDIDASLIWTNEAEVNGQPGVDDDKNGYIDDLYGWNWVDDNKDPSDDFGHGTANSAVIAATTNNEIGIAGIGRNVKIMPIKVLDHMGGGYIDDLISALEYIASVEEIRVVNLSLVLQFNSPLLAEAIQKASETKILVAPTGNVGEEVYYPAAYAETIAVAATDQNDHIASFSNRGSEVSVAAPGVDVLVASLLDGSTADYEETEGTSVAVPHVSALAALIASLRPDFSNEQIREIIEDSSVDINANEYPGRDNFIGHGRIDNYQALLDASVGLQIESINATENHVDADDSLDYAIQVQTPATTRQEAKPVQNAVVQYQLVGANEPANGSAATPPVSGHLLTNASGKVNIVFTAPAEEGSYLLQLRVGQEEVEFPVVVGSKNRVHITQTIASSTMRVGDKSTLVTIEAHDENGNPISGSLPLRLTANLGSFGSGLANENEIGNAQLENVQVLETIIQNGVYSTTFYAGKTSGIAMIDATVLGANPVQTQVKLRANVATSIALQSDVEKLLTDKGETSATFTILIEDAYGNQVDEPFYVTLDTNSGEITPLLFQAAGDDPLTAVLTVPADASGLITVRAKVKGTSLATQATVEAQRNGTVLLPIIR